MRDHDELRAVRVAAQELDEASDVRVVERGLDLVEEVEGARLREEQREEERDRPERLLPTREQRETRDLLACRPELHLDSGLDLGTILGRLDQPEPALPAGEEGRRDLLEVRGDRSERLVEPAVDGLRQLVPQGRELRERRLEVGALCRELLEPHLLRLVLLLRQRVDLPERFPARLEPRQPCGELVAVDAFLRPGSLLRLSLGLLARLLEAAPCVARLAVQSRELDLDGRQPLRRVVGDLTHLDLPGTELAKRRAELPGAGRAGVHPRSHRGFEARRQRSCALDE